MSFNVFYKVKLFIWLYESVERGIIFFAHLAVLLKMHNPFSGGIKSYIIFRKGCFAIHIYVVDYECPRHGSYHTFKSEQSVDNACKCQGFAFLCMVNGPRRSFYLFCLGLLGTILSSGKILGTFQRPSWKRFLKGTQTHVWDLFFLTSRESRIWYCFLVFFFT